MRGACARDLPSLTKEQKKARTSRAKFKVRCGAREWSNETMERRRLCSAAITASTFAGSTRTHTRVACCSPARDQGDVGRGSAAVEGRMPPRPQPGQPTVRLSTKRRTKHRSASKKHLPADTFLNDILAMSTLRHPHLYLPGSRRTASTLNNFTLDLTRTPRVLSPVCQLRREVTTAARGSAGTITTYTGANPSRGRKSVKKAKYKQRETCGVYTCDASCAVPSPLTSQPERTT